MKNCDICANDVFRESWKAAGVEPKAFQPPAPASPKATGRLACCPTTAAPIKRP